MSEVFEIMRDGRPVLFPSLGCLIAGRSLDEDEVYRQVWWQIHEAMPKLYECASRCNRLHDLLAMLVKELDVQPPPADVLAGESVRNGLGIVVGEDRDGQAVYWHMNDSSRVENPHAAIIGLSGQGKTQFALDVLLQIRRADSDITFTILDYKGDLSEAGSPALAALTGTMACELIRVGASPIPVVPFQATDTADPQQMAVAKAELFGKLYPRLGAQQRLYLRQALENLFREDARAGFRGFGFEALDRDVEALYEENGRKPDGLVEMTSKLRALRPFLESSESPTGLFNRRLLVRLTDLETDSLPTAFLVLDRLYQEMRQLPDAPRVGNTVSLRHVVFIDEAHHYLPYRASPLTSIIREGRSKGVAVLLATQTVSDLAGASGADYREFLSTLFFFRTNVLSVGHIKAMVPGKVAREFADTIGELGVGEMLFTRHLAPGQLRRSVIRAVQFYRDRGTGNVGNLETA